MPRRFFLQPTALALSLSLSLGLLLSAISGSAVQGDSPKSTAKPENAAVVKPGDVAPDTPPATEEEARGRARLLHEAFHATLHFVHEEYYRPDQRLTIPATTLDRVFTELEKRRNVKLHWLAVNAQAMNVDHIPQDEFEKAAVVALTSGKDEFERVENGTFRYAGAITLTSDCLKCHLPSRTSTKSRLAALVISLPLKTPPEKGAGA